MKTSKITKEEKANIKAEKNELKSIAAQTKKHAKKIKKVQKKVDNKIFDIDNEKYLSFYELFFIFMVCNIIGYCVEMVFCYAKNGYWESRQSLIYGPFGLAYGLGGVLLTLLLFKDTKKAWWKIFIKSYILGTVAEYIFSLGEELLFGHVSWDYSDVPLNINGRVCALYSVFWGLLGLAWVKLIYPLFNKTIHKIPIKTGKIIFWIVFILIFADILLSCEAVLRQHERFMGIAADSKFEEFLDRHYTDEYLSKVYANAQKVK